MFNLFSHKERIYSYSEVISFFIAFSDLLEFTMGHPAAFAPSSPLSAATSRTQFAYKCGTFPPFSSGPPASTWRCCISAPSFPEFVPSEADLIDDKAARRVLAELESVPIQTSLRNNPIGTVCHRENEVTDDDAATKPVMVCLHGFDSNLLEYRYLSPLLASRGIDVHCVDLLGWGLTEKDPNISYGVDARREHLVAFLESLQSPDGVTVAGASLGGAVALDVALERPDLVSNLVLVDAQVYTDRPSGAPRFFAEIGARILRSSFLRNVAVQLSYESPAMRADENILKIGKLHTHSSGWFNAAVDFIAQKGYCLKDRVSEVSIPTLVIWGENDRVLPKNDADKFKNDIPDAQFVRIMGAGHSPHIEKPQDVADAMAQFLKCTQISTDSNVNVTVSTSTGKS